MAGNFFNVYEDTGRADSYAVLEFPNTYYLAFRDLPLIISKHIKGKGALDFGCGAGRSTRFLKKLGFSCIGIDISNEMIKKAKEFDPDGIYECTIEDDFRGIERNHFDLIQSIFTFDNIPDKKNRAAILSNLSKLLKPEGRIILLDSTPEMYQSEWASFTTKAFPGNKTE